MARKGTWVEVMLKTSGVVAFAVIGKWSLYCLLAIGIGVFALRGSAARFMHLFAYPAFFLALVHGLFEGTDVGLAWMQTVYWLAAISIVFIGTYYLITSFSEPPRA